MNNMYSKKQRLMSIILLFVMMFGVLAEPTMVFAQSEVVNMGEIVKVDSKDSAEGLLDRSSEDLLSDTLNNEDNATNIIKSEVSKEDNVYKVDNDIELFTHKEKDGQIIITGLKEGVELEDNTLIIPNEINGKSVVKISDYAFHKLIPEVTVLTFENDNINRKDNKLTIGKYAFADNNIESVSFNTTVNTIDEYAFLNNSISDINLTKANIKHLNAGAFKNNKLTDVDIYLSNIEYLDPEAFVGNNGLKYKKYSELLKGIGIENNQILSSNVNVDKSKEDKFNIDDKDRDVSNNNIEGLKNINIKNEAEIYINTNDIILNNDEDVEFYIKPNAKDDDYVLLNKDNNWSSIIEVSDINHFIDNINNNITTNVEVNRDYNIIDKSKDGNTIFEIFYTNTNTLKEALSKNSNAFNNDFLKEGEDISDLFEFKNIVYNGGNPTITPFAPDGFIYTDVLFEIGTKDLEDKPLIISKGDYVKIQLDNNLKYRNIEQGIYDDDNKHIPFYFETLSVNIGNKMVPVDIYMYMDDYSFVYLFQNDEPVNAKDVQLQYYIIPVYIDFIKNIQYKNLNDNNTATLDIFHQLGDDILIKEVNIDFSRHLFGDEANLDFKNNIYINDFSMGYKMINGKNTQVIKNTTVVNTFEDVILNDYGARFDLGYIGLKEHIDTIVKQESTEMMLRLTNVDIYSNTFNEPSSNEIISSDKLPLSDIFKLYEVEVDNGKVNTGRVTKFVKEVPYKLISENENSVDILFNFQPNKHYYVEYVTSFTGPNLQKPPILSLEMNYMSDNGIYDKIFRMFFSLDTVEGEGGGGGAEEDYDTIDINVNKAWTNEYIKPVYMYLTKNDNIIESFQLNDKNNWQVVFKDIVYEEGDVFDIIEVEDDEYELIENKQMITDTGIEFNLKNHMMPKVDIKFKKN